MSISEDLIRFESTLDPIEQGKKLHKRLSEVAEELRRHGQMARTDAGKELAELDASTCERAAAIIRILGTEVDRLRLGIQHFDHGRMDRFALRDMTKNWNYGPRDGNPDQA
jgi:hypothetical protein